MQMPFYRASYYANDSRRALIEVCSRGTDSQERSTLRNGLKPHRYELALRERPLVRRAVPVFMVECSLHLVPCRRALKHAFEPACIQCVFHQWRWSHLIK